MAYTVKELSRLSGVTVRTLHYYEEEGLLQPANYGSNGYRYYGENELIQLQQILFFKELGFTIRQIKGVVGESDYTQLKALSSHQKLIDQQIKKLRRLRKTVDATINHLTGEKPMSHQAIFAGFNITVVNQADTKCSYSEAETIVFNSVRNPTKSDSDVVNRGKKYHQDLTDQTHAIFTQLAKCIESGMEPSGAEVQKLIRQHHQIVNRIQDATEKVYHAMAQLYREHPEFKQQLVAFHPDLPKFMSEAMMAFSPNA